jgi:hypothetical protein
VIDRLKIDRDKVFGVKLRVQFGTGVEFSFATCQLKSEAAS